MSDNDLIRRGDAIAACAVGPSDEWARATKSGYTQAATDCTFNVLRIPAVQVTLKPLEWGLVTTMYEPCEAYEAISPVGVYVVAQDEDSPSRVNVEYGVGPDTFHKGQPLLLNVVLSFAAAKAAAQADYEGRILAALESAHRVNETPKSEHDRADVLTALEPATVTLADALKVPEVEALIGLIPEVIASLDATRCNVSLTSDLRAALRAIGEGEA